MPRLTRVARVAVVLRPTVAGCPTAPALAPQNITSCAAPCKAYHTKRKHPQQLHNETTLGDCGRVLGSTQATSPALVSTGPNPKGTWTLRNLNPHQELSPQSVAVPTAPAVPP
mmetsp:Transcript_48803/g.86949  ORF Transcript_48803/g.86949 Transcript_48803/m.86949 type:complete len:113 (-) Transcript_48803:116-454(-)